MTTLNRPYDYTPFLSPCVRCNLMTGLGLISPIIFGNAFIQREKRMGEMSFIPPKSLLNPSRHLSHDTQATLIGTTS